MNFAAITKVKSSHLAQYVVSVGLVCLIASILFIFTDILGYRVVALILLMVVSFLAMMFDILPVLTAAILSSLIWNLFFIPPIFTFHIENADDNLMFLMYFIIASVNGVLTYKIREAEKIERDKVEKEKSIVLYNTLLNSLSHELRTPISTIIGAVDILTSHSGQLAVETEKELLSEIDSASMRLNRQVENLLNMSRLETGMLKLQMQWTDLNELIYTVQRKLSGFSASHHIIFEPSGEVPLCKLDTTIMEEVLYNLLHNALSYTPEGSVIRITTALAEDYCQIIIADNGQGFPAAEIQFAFDKFYRLPHSKAGGTGLGLSIVRGFIEAHQGTIELTNNSSGGCTFTIRIPCEVSLINNLMHD